MHLLRSSRLDLALDWAIGQPIGRIPGLDNGGLEGLQQWLEALAGRGLLFHLDDDPAQVIESHTLRRIFTDEEVDWLRYMVPILFEAHGDEVHRLALKVAAPDGSDEDDGTPYCAGTM